MYLWLFLCPKYKKGLWLIPVRGNGFLLVLLAMAAPSLQPAGCSFLATGPRKPPRGETV